MSIYVFKIHFNIFEYLVFVLNPLPPIGSLREQHPAHKITPVCAELHKN